MSDYDQRNAFAALHRLLAVVSPELGEGRWQWEHSFRRLPASLQAPGHWYRGAVAGFIHVDENLNGEFVKELPPAVDPASVVDVPSANRASVLDTMASLLPDIAEDARPHFTSVLNNLRETAKSDHARLLVRDFQQHVFTFVVASAEDFLQYVEKTATDYREDGLAEGKVCGEDAAAVLLIQALCDATKADADKAIRVWRMLAAPGRASLTSVAAQMVRDCVTHGLSEAAYTALAELSKQGNGMVDAAREGMYPLGHPGMMLPLYYFSLLLAAPYLRASMIGYEMAALNPDLSDKQSRLYASRANAAEEKLARVCDGIMFSVRDLDGSEARAKRAAVQAFLAAGDEDRADGLVMEVVDLHLYLPKPFRQYLLAKDLESLNGGTGA